MSVPLGMDFVSNQPCELKWATYTMFSFLEHSGPNNNIKNVNFIEVK